MRFSYLSMNASLKGFIDSTESDDRDDSLDFVNLDLVFLE